MTHLPHLPSVCSRRSRTTSFLLCLFAANIAVAQTPSPAIPGNHPLTEAQQGALLIAELRCGACHAGVPEPAFPARTAPDLAEVGSRIAPDYLRRFLAAPATAHPGTTMPDVLAAAPPAEREQIAEALTHFLVSQASQPFQPQPSDQPQTAAGRTLFHTVGCVACHGPRDPAPELPPNPQRPEEDDPDDVPPPKPSFAPIALPLGHVAKKYSPHSLTQFLFQPLRVRSSGRMPDMQLTPAEAQALADYLLDPDQPHAPPLTPQPALVQAGRQYYQKFNCAACHPLPGQAAAPQIAAWKATAPSRGCLSEKPGPGPHYGLTAAQSQAVRAAIAAPPAPAADALVVAQTLTALRCIACHIRDSYGGVPEEYNPYFSGTEKNLGEDGRIPPPLTLVGAKLQPA
ncbi:MAG: c-type cytochrome [Planctomycetes bacterium]|nr:c-type cytochrome [Planctomycetota bacterium]